MHIIGISGKKKSGKSTVSNMIEKSYPSGSVIQLAFADALKREVSEACGVTIEEIEKYKDNFRLILQGWGTDFRRKICNDNYWIDKMMNKIYSLPLSIRIVIITDVRFLNEATLINNYNGILLRVNRPSEFSIDAHHSECELDKYNFTHFINNDSSISELNLLVQGFLLNNQLITNTNVHTTRL